MGFLLLLFGPSIAQIEAKCTPLRPQGLSPGATPPYLRPAIQEQPMQMDPEGMAPEDLSHAGSVVDKAIEYMMDQNIDPISVASALLGGALGLLAKTLDDRGVANVLRNALASVESGELRAMREHLPGGAG